MLKASQLRSIKAKQGLEESMGLEPIKATMDAKVSYPVGKFSSASSDVLVGIS